MTPSIPDIARRVLELDGKATPGPWRPLVWRKEAEYSVMQRPASGPCSDVLEPGYDFACVYSYTPPADVQEKADTEAMAHYRTSAPALARFALSATEREARLRALLKECRDLLDGDPITHRIDAALAAEEKTT